MKNFEYYNPARIIFGKGTIPSIRKYIPADTAVLFVYGSGSIHQNGVYDQVIKALVGHKVLEFSGITPNPAYEQLMPALDIIREHQVGFILAVGGGSVIDGAKFIAAAACYEGEDPWNILAKGEKVKKAIPLGTVLTLPATATEMNGNAVISRLSVNQKLAFGSHHVIPVFSVLDPEVTYSLPKSQLANGIIDAYIYKFTFIFSRFGEIAQKSLCSFVKVVDIPDISGNINYKDVLVFGCNQVHKLACHPAALKYILSRIG